MAISIKHKFTSLKADGPDTTRIRPSNWNDTHEILMATGRLLGRATAADGAAEEIPLASTLEFSGGSLGVAAATISRITALEDQKTTGVPLRDTNNTHNLLLKSGSDLTADRNFNIITGDAVRNLTLGGDLTTVGNVSITTFMQSLLDDASAADARTTLGITASANVFEYVGNFTASAAATFDITTGFHADYDHYLFIFKYAYPSLSTHLRAVVSENAGSSYIAGTAYSSIVANLNAAPQTVSGGASWTITPTGAMTATQAGGYRGNFQLIRNSATQTSFVVDGVHSTLVANLGGGVVTTTAKANAVRFSANGANITASVDMFRIKNT